MFFTEKESKTAPLFIALCIQLPVPVKFLGCDRMLQSLNTAHQGVISPFQAIRGRSPGMDITVVKLLLFTCLNRYGRFRLHQKGPYEIDGCDGPEAAYEQKDDSGSPDPENRKIEIFCDPSANAQYDPVS
jgi:hypothetical protein